MHAAVRFWDHVTETWIYSCLWLQNMSVASDVDTQLVGNMLSVPRFRYAFEVSVWHFVTAHHMLARVR